MKHLTDEEIKQTYRRLFPRGAYILDESVVLFGRALLEAAGASEPDEYASEADTDELLELAKLPEPLRIAAMLEKTMQSPLHGKAADCLRILYGKLENIRGMCERFTGQSR